MSLADCIKSVSGLTPEDVAAIQAAVAAKVAAGQTQIDAEREAVGELNTRVASLVEDLRSQLNAPQPVDIVLDNATDQQLDQPNVRVIGEKELGNTLASRNEYFSRPFKQDEGLEKAGQGIPELQNSLFRRENGNPIVLRVADMEGNIKQPVLSEGGPGEPYYLSAEQAFATEAGLLPGATVAKLAEAGAKQLTKQTGDEGYRDGMPIVDTLKRLQKSMSLDEAAALALGALTTDTFETTLVYRGPDNQLRVITEPQLLIDPQTKQELELFQPGARGSIQIVDDTYYVNMFPGMDLSTLSHEMGHMFLHEMRRIVSTGKASKSTVERYQTLLEWLGNKGENFTVDQHEKFAATWELYLLEGKAPSAALRDSFGASRRWLTRIYSRVVAGDPQAGLEQVAGQKLSVPLEVREVFDRMLTLTPEVEGAALDAEFIGLSSELDEKLPEELRGEARIRIDDLLVEARQKMEDRLFEHRAKAIADMKPTWKREAEKQVKEMKVYKAVAFLKKSPLDRTQIQSEFGDAAFKALSTKHGSLVTNEPDILGLDVDMAAEQLGYESGQELIAALRKEPTEGFAVQRAVKALADDQWSAYGPEDAMAETPEFAELMELSRTYLATILGRTGAVDKRDIRRRAEQMIATMPIRQATDVESFLQGMARLQRQERVLATKGDLNKALEKNIDARMHFEMARIARQVKADVAKVVAFAKQIPKIDPKTVEYQYLLNAAAVAARYGLIPAGTTPERENLRKLLSARNVQVSETHEPALDVAASFPPWVLDEQGEGDYHDKTIGDLIDIDHIMRLLLAHGKRLRSNEIFDGKAKLEDVVAEIMTPMADLKDKRVPEEGTIAAKIVGAWDSLMANLNIWQFRVKAVDGFTDTNTSGPAERNMFDPLHRGSEERIRKFASLHKLIRPAFDHLSQRVRSAPKYVDGLEPTAQMKERGRNGITLEATFVVALNMGNTYNAEAMARGLGYLTSDGSPDVSRLYDMTKHLTKADWEAIVKITEAIESLKADHYAAFQKRNGFPLAEIDPEPFTVKTADGETLKLKGWYYPVKFDPTLSEAQAKNDDAADRLNAGFSAFPMVGTRTGMQQLRKGTGGRPLLLSLSGIDSHFNDVIQYTVFGEVVVDVFRISQHPAFKSAYTKKFGEKAYKAIRTMLADIGMPNQGLQTELDWWLSGLKGLSSAWALGWNVKTYLTQPFSAINYASEEGPLTIASGLKQVMSMGVEKAKEKMFELSATMQDRWEANDREVADSIKSTSWMSKPKWKKLRESVYVLIQHGDRSTMLPLWWGAFQKRLDSGMNEADAAAGATKAILLTYPGNPRALDASNWLRSKNGLMRLLTSFATQAFHFGNRQRFYLAGVKSGQVSKARFAQHVATEWITAPLLMTAFFQILWGNWPPEDEEDYKKYLVSLGTYQFTGIPIVKEIVNTFGHPERGFGGNISAFKGLDIIGNTGATIGHLISDLEDDKDPKFEKALWAMADMASFFSGVPASQVVKRMKRGLEQLDAFPNDDSRLEWLNDAFTVLSPDPEKRLP